MKRISFFLIALTFTFTFIATGCHQQSLSARQNMPASTMSVVDHIDDCYDGFVQWRNRLDDEYEGCMDEVTSPGYEECRSLRDNNEEVAYDWRLQCLIELPQVDLVCVEQLEPFSHEQDSDGDGVEDYWEYEMGTNPCERCSFGGTPGVDCDGDLDWDRDGVPNDIDAHPLCGAIQVEGEWNPVVGSIIGTNCI